MSRLHGAIAATVARGRTQRQIVLDYLVAYQAEHGWMPTVREVADAMGLASASTAHQHLRNLHADGRIVLGGGPRMIRVTAKGHIDMRDWPASPVGGVGPVTVRAELDACTERPGCESSLHLSTCPEHDIAG